MTERNFFSSDYSEWTTDKLVTSLDIWTDIFDRQVENPDRSGGSRLWNDTMMKLGQMIVDMRNELKSR